MDVILRRAGNLLIKRDHDLGKCCRILAPRAQNRRRLFSGTVALMASCRRKSLLLEHADHLLEVLRQRIARAENIEFLLHKQPRLVADQVFRISDVDNAPA